LPKPRSDVAGVRRTWTISTISVILPICSGKIRFRTTDTQLIYAAYANASLYALRSASHKLLNYAQNAREYLDFRYQGLTVAFEALELNIARLEEDMALQTRQRVVSDEVKHEVEEALNATADFMGAQKTALHQAIGEVFSAQHILDLAGIDRQNLTVTS
jgi:hypothetical protein